MNILRKSTNCLFLIILLSITTLAFGQTAKKTNKPGLIGQSEHYEFYSHFWFNMHHFFQREALTLEVTQKSIISPESRNKLSKSDREILDEVIGFYGKNLVDKNIRSDDYMSDFKKWIITQDENEFTSIPDKFKNHISQLQKIKKVYRDNFWTEHHTINKKVLDDNLKLIQKTEKGVIKKLVDLTRSYWQNEKVRIDIVFYAQATRWNMRDRPYTSIFPTHVVMNSSGDADKPFGNWLELLYHESSHPLILSRIGFVGGTILDIAEVSGENPPRDLWHAYLFYFSGFVSKEALESQGIKNYELYMVRNKVFSRYIPFLEKHLPDYINRKRTLKDVTESIFQELNKK